MKNNPQKERGKKVVEINKRPKAPLHLTRTCQACANHAHPFVCVCVCVRTREPERLGTTHEHETGARLFCGTSDADAIRVDQGHAHGSCCHSPAASSPCASTLREAASVAASVAPSCVPGAYKSTFCVSVMRAAASSPSMASILQLVRLFDTSPCENKKCLRWGSYPGWSCASAQTKRVLQYQAAAPTTHPPQRRRSDAKLTGVWIRPHTAEVPGMMTHSCVQGHRSEILFEKAADQRLSASPLSSASFSSSILRASPHPQLLALFSVAFHQHASLTNVAACARREGVASFALNASPVASLRLISRTLRGGQFTAEDSAARFPFAFHR